MKEHAKIVQSRNAIEESGIKALLRNPDASVSEIALAAGVGRATLYRHYESRDVLIQSLARKCLEETDELAAPLKAKKLSGRKAIEATIDVLMPMADRFKFLLNLWSIAGNDATVRAIYKRQLEEMYQLIEQAKKAGDVCNTLSTPWVVAVFDNLLYASWQMIKNEAMNPEEAAEAFKKTFFSGCQ
ncbi:MAG: TetR/AcrR family transcriptional regulator [Pseudomonadales bacterium]